MTEVNLYCSSLLSSSAVDIIGRVSFSGLDKGGEWSPPIWLVTIGGALGCPKKHKKSF